MHFRLIQFKYLHRAYYTRARLWQMGVIQSPLCLRCDREEGSFLHTVWSCSALQPFWHQICLCLLEVLSWDLPLDPRLFLFHSTEDIGGNRYKQHLLFLALAVAKRDIAQMWKATSPPTLGKWKTELDNCMGAEIAVFEARGCPAKHCKIWTRWADYRGIELPPLARVGPLKLFRYVFMYRYIPTESFKICICIFLMWHTIMTAPPVRTRRLEPVCTFFVYVTYVFSGCCYRSEIWLLIQTNSASLWPW